VQQEFNDIFQDGCGLTVSRCSSGQSRARSDSSPILPGRTPLYPIKASLFSLLIVAADLILSFTGSFFQRLSLK